MPDRRTCALLICIALTVVPLGALVEPPDSPVGPEDAISAPEVPTVPTDAAALLSGLEPRFTENLGQLGAAGGDFYARGEPLSVALGTGWMAYDVLDDEGRTLVKMTFPGAREVAPAGAVPLDHTSSFFRGPDPERWVSGARSYERVVYEGLWDGIDLVFRFSDGLLKYDLVLAPGADASDVAVRYEGATDLSVDPATGDLLIGTHSRPLRDLAPTANQVVSGESVEVTVDLRLVDATTVGFVVGDHDGDVPLVIDPGLVFGTYVGGADSEFYVQGKVDGEGCVYVGGSTDSMDFPTTPGAFKRSKIEWVTDAFVFKLSADGSALVYSTYIGSDEEMGLDYFNDIAVDAEGCAYITGSTYFGYPTTAGAFSRTVNGSDTDTFLTKLSKDGTSLEYSTYFGGPQEENR